MGTGYTRNDVSNSIANGNVVDADTLDGEFNAIVAAFASSTGHTHDGTSAEGGAIAVIGPAQEYVGDGTALAPKTTEVYDLGKSSLAWNNLYIGGIFLGGTQITATAAEINALDGLTATAAELNILDGATVTTAELNILDGVTATTAELNYLDITTLGTSEASKAVTADANGDVVLSEELKAKSYNETFVSVTSATGTATVDCEAGNVFGISLSENTTFVFSNPPATGTAYGFTLKITQDSTARTATWPASVDWPSGLDPTLTTTSGAVDVFVFFTHDGGTTWYGFTAGQDMK